MRKSPTTHKVSSHIRDKRHIKSYFRGRGEIKQTESIFNKYKSRKQPDHKAPVIEINIVHDDYNLFPYSWETVSGSIGGGDRIAIIYDPKLTHEGRSDGNGIRLGKKFFELPQMSQNYILAHEVGHDLEYKASESIINTYYDELEKGAFVYEPLKGIGNVSEVFAETFSVFVHDNVNGTDELFTRYPKIYTIHKALLSKYPKQYKFGAKIAKGLVTIKKKDE